MINALNDVPKVPHEFKIPNDLIGEGKEIIGDVKETWKEFLDSISEFRNNFENKELSKEVIEARDYLIAECSEVTKESFTIDVINNWVNLNLETRDSIIQNYTKNISECLKVKLKGVVWEYMQPNEYGYNNGDGYLHLNSFLLSNPAQLMKLIDTVAHEARHELQKEVMRNPEKYPIDSETVKEWKEGNANYTLENATAYNPWGYFYNPMETDARFFGESMVRELTKDIINNFA